MGTTLTALLGYALGTAQVLFVDWWRRRREHIRQLRLLRAELRQVHERVGEGFNWDPSTGPESDATPNPARLSNQYGPVVAATDFYLTDEHDDDNGQQALLNIVDGADLLRRYHEDVLLLVDELRGEEDDLRRMVLRDRAIATTEVYDREARRLEYMVRSALADLERRLTLTGFREQLRRSLRGRLPPGENPEPLRGLDDPRLTVPATTADEPPE